MASDKHVELVSRVTEAVRGANSLTLYEGLPHQMFEAELLERERRSQRVREIKGYPFYEEPLELAGGDATLLSTILAEPSSYMPFSGEKLCGGFHPDFAVEWRCDGKSWRALICFGCQEVKLVCRQLSSRKDLDYSAYQRLWGTLRNYRKYRPVQQRT